jgi:hypothetical protein
MRGTEMHTATVLDLRFTSHSTEAKLQNLQPPLLLEQSSPSLFSPAVQKAIWITSPAGSGRYPKIAMLKTAVQKANIDVQDVLRWIRDEVKLSSANTNSLTCPYHLTCRTILFIYHSKTNELSIEVDDDDDNECG